MNEGDKVIIEIIKGVATIRFEPAKNEKFLDDMVEDECEDLEDEDLEEDDDEEDEEEDYDGEEYFECEDEDCRHCKENEKDIEMITILEKLLEVLKNILKY